MALATTLNFSNTTPTPPSDQQNIEWQNDGGTPTCNESAYDPLMVGDNGSSGGGLSGNVPAPAAGDAAAGKFLKADATWKVPPGASPMIGDTGGSGGGEGGSVPAPPAGSAAAGKFLKADATWEVPAGGSGGLPTGSGNEVVATPADGSSAPAALRALVPADLPVATGSAFGIVKPDGSTITISGGVISSSGGGGSSAGVIHTGAGVPPVGTPATVAHVQSAVNPTSGSLAFGSNVTEGNLLIVLEVGESGFGYDLQPTDTVGTVYARAQVLASTLTIAATIWYGIAPASGANTVTWSQTGVTSPVTAVSEFSGASALIDAMSAPVYNMASPASAAVVASVAGDLIYAVSALLWGDGTPAVFTAGSGFTLATSNGGGGASQPMAVEYNLSGGSGSNTAAISFTVNDGDRGDFTAIAFYAKQIGTPGSDGDFYLDTASRILYGPRIGGVYLPSDLALPATGATPGTYNNPTITVEADGRLTSVAGGAGGGSALVQLAKVTVSSGGQASIDFSSIPNSYSDLLLVFSGASATSSSSDSLDMIFNGDTGANYNWACSFIVAAPGVNAYVANGATSLQLSDLQDSNSPTRAALARCLIGNYANTSFYKAILAEDTYWNGLRGYIARSGEWMSTAAINEITLKPNGGTNFVEGTVCTLYGML